MAIRGQVDGMVGAYVVGWAVAQPDIGNCNITITDDQGQQVAKGRASRHRADLAGLGLGRTTLAFRILVGGMAAARPLHIMADGIELPGSPILVGQGRFDGNCTLEQAVVSGWVTERVSNFQPPVITIVNQYGGKVGEAQSTHDLYELDAHFGPARFAIPLEDKCFGAGELRLSVLANGIKFWELSCNLKLQGNLETITAEACSGWLLSPDVPHRSFMIDVFRDDVLAGSAACDMPREDVRGVFAECKTPGFSTELTKSPMNPVAAARISLRLRGADADLFQSPYVIASRPAAVVAAQRALRLSGRELEGIGAAERAVIQMALGEFLAASRQGSGFTAVQQAGEASKKGVKPRICVIVPVYRGVDITRACIESVLTHRNPATDHLVLINDCSPDADMAGMLAHYIGRENVSVLSNEFNLGFVKTVNRGLGFALGADVLLLNSDTAMFAGGLDELCHVAYVRPEIGVVTAMSNNATVFSYPHAALRDAALPDIGWAELAAAALRENSGKFFDVPTGHGFCMLIKGAVLRRTGFLDEAFGRGYGEENDLCARAAKLGYRSVAAAGVLVEHRESISFEGEKESLMALNIPRLNAMYPEYTPVIMEFERTDGLRGARWALDRIRLENAVAAGRQFVLVVSNALDGGTAKAIKDIEDTVGYGGATKLMLRCQATGVIELLCDGPSIWASFLADEMGELFAVLDAAAPRKVLVHQLLGFPGTFIGRLGAWAKPLHTVYYAHDFYPFCPRVTMIDAIGRFCDVADAGTCGRCVEMGGAHETSRLDELDPVAHRAVFGNLLGDFTHVVAPSANTANYLMRAFPELSVKPVQHPEAFGDGAGSARDGSFDEIVLFGAIGPHKGSGKLLEIARRARLTHPHLRFRVIGYTNIDKDLAAIGNVTITGRYKPEHLPGLIAKTQGKLAIFLSTWPETYSYTLSEAVKHGFIPLVPDLGAPAERVRAVRFGAVYPFPADAAQILGLIDDLAAGRVAAFAEGAKPQDFYPDAAACALSAEVLMVRSSDAPPAKGSRKRSASR